MIVTLPHRTKRVGVSLLLGVTIALVLSFLSQLAIRLVPYRDLPIMPKPFFLYTLAPGLIVAEQFERGWVQQLAYYLTNSLFYAVAVFCVTALIRTATRRA
jgi:hypothetical protein